jgi:hypothetical protein
VLSLLDTVSHISLGRPQDPSGKIIQAREAGDSQIIWMDVRATTITRFAGSIDILVLHLGLTPQALR